VWSKLIGRGTNAEPLSIALRRRPNLRAKAIGPNRKVAIKPNFHPAFARFARRGGKLLVSQPLQPSMKIDCLFYWT
jgi:hypothetical protein